MWVILADDFECIEAGPIADIHIWTSFAYDQVYHPPIRLSIYADIPDPDPSDSANWSMPGALLWSEDFLPGDYTVRRVADNSPQDMYLAHTGAWDDDNHTQAFQYNFYPDEPFIQEYCNTYWLGLELIHEFIGFEEWFGWKTTKADHPDLRWGDDGVYLDLDLGWLPMIYPVGPSESGTFHEYAGQTLDLAFVITPEPATLGLLLVGGMVLLRRRYWHC